MQLAGTVSAARETGADALDRYEEAWATCRVEPAKPSGMWIMDKAAARQAAAHRLRT